MVKEFIVNDNDPDEPVTFTKPQPSEPILYEFGPVIHEMDPRFHAKIVFQEELKSLHPQQAGQFCDLCDEIVVQHKWAIVDGFGFIVIACSNVADNHLRLKDSDQ